MKELTIRKFKENDEGAISKLVRRNFLEVNIKDYSKDKMEALAAIYDDNKVLQIASYAHMYVACLNNEVIGCGAISSFWGREDKSILLTIFVLPEFHGNGIGRKIIESLERDEYFLRADSIVIPASITAVPFYAKMGYTYKNGIKEMDEEGHIRLEKIR